MDTKMLTTPEAAERLGISAERVRHLIKTGRLPSQQFGRDDLISEADLVLVSERKPGRPPLTEEEKAERTASRESPATVTSEVTKQAKPKAAKPATKKTVSQKTEGKKAGSKKAGSKKAATKSSKKRNDNE